MATSGTRKGVAREQSPLSWEACGCEGPRGLVLGLGMRQNWDRKTVLGSPLELPYSQWPAHEERKGGARERTKRRGQRAETLGGKRREGERIGGAG